jgi:hypothetical protein
MRTLPLLLVLASVAFADGNPELDKANRMLFDQKYGEAARALEAATKVPNNPRDVVLRIYELQGVVYGQLGQSAKAKEAFEAMLSLDPKRELNGKYNQKVLAAFAAAKDWLGANPPLDFKSAKAALDPKNRVMQLAAKVKSDGMKLTRKVRFHLRADEGKWVDQTSELQGAYAAANTDAAGVEWWAELLGDNERVLAVVGSEKDPVREGNSKAPAVVAVADAPKKDEPKPAEKKVEPAPTDDKKPDELRYEPAPTGGSSSGVLRPIGYGLMAGGLIGVGVGAVFGVQSFVARGRINSAMTNASGLIVGLNQRDAFALDKQATQQALIADILFGAGGGLAVIGGVFWLVGGLTGSSDSASLTISPTPGGVLVRGEF